MDYLYITGLAHHLLRLLRDAAQIPIVTNLFENWRQI